MEAKLADMIRFWRYDDDEGSEVHDRVKSNFFRKQLGVSSTSEPAVTFDEWNRDKTMPLCGSMKSKSEPINFLFGQNVSVMELPAKITHKLTIKE